MPPAMRRIDVAVVSPDAGLRAEVCALFAPGRYRVLEVGSVAEASAGFDAEASARLVFAVLASPPSTAEVQALLDAAAETDAVTICAFRTRLDSTSAASLIAVGLHEIVPLLPVDGGAVDVLVSASLARERDRRELLRGGERALLKRDVAAAMAMARTPRAIRDAFADGMIALGAEGVACWAPGERGLHLATHQGAPIERRQPTQVGFDALHPAVAALRGPSARWYLSAATARAEHAAFEPVGEHLAIAALPVAPGEDALESVLVALPALPDEVERRAIEQLCSLLGETLRRARRQDELEQQRDAHRRLIGAIGQDLIDPLNTLAVGARMLRADLDPGTASTFTPIELAAQSALRLVENALTFARSASGELELSRRDLDVLALLASAVGDARRGARGGRAVTLETGATRAVTEVDEVRLAQALANLLSNALTHSPDGATIAVRATSDEHAVYIDVENPAPGLGPARLDEIRRSMKQLSAASARGSAGLGLYLVDAIVAAHGGRVWAEAAPPDAVRFSVQLPRRARSGAVDLPAVAAGSPRWPGGHRLDPVLAQLAARFRDPALGVLLAAWAEARGPDRAMPHPLDLDRGRLLAHLPDLVSAQVSLGPDGEPVFSWSSVGARLERRLRGTLPGTLDAADERRRAQYEMYRRCFRQREPTHDYVHQRRPRAYSFERLLLPMTRMREAGPTDILGLVLFSAPPGREDDDMTRSER